MTGNMTNIEEELIGAPRPRICLINRLQDEQFGFQLDAGIVGKVKENSPAHRAGLMQGDRIIALNGQTIGKNYRELIVKMIYEDQMQCELLVINEEDELWYAQRNIPVTPDLPNIDHYCQTLNNQVQTLTIDTEIDRKSECRLERRHLMKRTPSDPLGFCLVTEMNSGEYFVGTVESGSVAEESGLIQGQKILEVNGVPTQQLAYEDLTALIRNNPESVVFVLTSVNESDNDNES